MLLAGASLIVTPATAETLREALAKSYENNPTLTAQRAQLRATDETVPIARAAGRPVAGVSAGFNENVIRGGSSFTSPARSATTGVNVTVPIFSGGAVRNSVRAAETRVGAGRASLRGVEASLFTEVVGAYNNVIRDEAVVSLNAQNVQVLDTNLRASSDRFEVGDLTRTDVAQSEARLALAKAQLQSAQAQLIGSRENYVRLVGAAPGVLEPPPALPALPQSPDAAVEEAVQENPTLIAARQSSEATAYDIRVAKAQRLPQVGVTVGANYQNFLGSLGAGSNQGVTFQQGGTSGALGLNLTVPFFQGGLPSARVRQAQALRSQAIEQATAAERQVVATTRSAYATWRASQLVIQSAENAVAANRLSLEGVRAENSVGNRTILDILNAEQELLNSQVTLVTARRDAYVAGFALLAAMGHAEADDLGLDGGALYDPTVNYNRVRNRLSDYDSDPAPQPVAPSTAKIGAQDATVTRALDPALDTPVDRDGPLATGTNPPPR